MFATPFSTYGGLLATWPPGAFLILLVAGAIAAAKCEGQGWGEPEGIHKDSLCTKIRAALQVGFWVALTVAWLACRGTSPVISSRFCLLWAPRADVASTDGAAAFCLCRGVAGR